MPYPQRNTVSIQCTRTIQQLFAHHANPTHAHSDTPQYLTLLSPVFQGIFIWMWAQFTLLTYNDTYIYPRWAQVFGLSLAFSSMVCIPLYFVFSLVTSPGHTLREVSQSVVIVVTSQCIF